MTDLIIDPYVFSCPHPDEGIQVFREYLDSIISWRELSDQKWARVFISNHTVEVLMETDTYPLWQGLQTAINHFHIQDVQPKDVVDLVNALLQKLPTIENETRLKEILFDDQSSVPDYHIASRSPNFIDQYFQVALTICLSAKLNGLDEISQLLITRLLSEDIVSSELRALIHDFDSTENIVHPLPIHLHSRLGLCNTPHGLYLTVDPLQIWVNADNDEDRAKALHIFIYQRVFESRGERVSENDFRWSFGESFCASAVAHGFLTNKARMRGLLRACSHTILREQMGSTRHLREGSGANAPQIKRGSDSAWRRTIDQEYRIHYWETDDGPEFACVASHNEFEIP